MKRLLNTLYVTTGNRYLSLDGENVVVLEDKRKSEEFLCIIAGNRYIWIYRGQSALMGACAQRNISLSFMSGNGKISCQSYG